MARKAQIEGYQTTSRWFRVIADRFDWMPKPTVMVSFKKGDIGYRPTACIEAGLAEGAIEVIEKPAGYHVDKNGDVLLDDAKVTIK